MLALGTRRGLFFASRQCKRSKISRPSPPGTSSDSALRSRPQRTSAGSALSAERSPLRSASTCSQTPTCCRNCERLRNTKRSRKTSSASSRHFRNDFEGKRRDADMRRSGRLVPDSKARASAGERLLRSPRLPHPTFNRRHSRAAGHCGVASPRAASECFFHFSEAS